MKFIFFGPSKEIDLLTQKFDKTSFSIHSDAAEVLAKAKEGPCLVFLNFDFNAEHAKTINESLAKESDVKRIVFSKTRNLKKEKIAADEYILGPLNKASFEGAFQEVMGGKTLSGYTIEGKGTSPDTNKSIQDAFDSVFAESKEETPPEEAAPPAEAAPPEEVAPPAEAAPPEEAAPEEVKTETPTAEPGAILDEESDLQFSVGGMEIPTGVKAESEITKPVEETPKATEEAPAEPAQELSGMTLDDGTTEPAPAPEEAGLGDLEIPSIDEGIPSLELGGAEEAPSPAPDLGMDLDLAASDSTVVAPSPSPEVHPPQQSAGISSDPSLEFTAATGTEESIKEKEQSREFVYDKPGSKLGTGSSEILARPSGMDTEVKPAEVEPEVESKAPEKAPFKVSDESAIKLEAIIRALREERENLLKEVKENRELKSKVLSENLNLEATTEELRVELSIIKKRNEEEFHEDSYEKKRINEKLKLAEEKNKRLQKDIDILSNQAQIDTNKVLQREKELENQLELLSMDSQNQILSREKKISELNRERDAIEYNMTNLISREKKLRQEKLEIEEKLNKIMRTMRNSIDFLEDEIEGNQKLLKELKK
jgi:hypothetical protein